MSDFTAAMHHDPHPHPKPTPKPPQPTIIDCILDAFGLVRKTRQLTKSDCKLVA